MKKGILFIFFLIATWSLKAQVDSASERIRENEVSYQYKHRMDTLFFKQDAIKFAYSFNGGHNLSIGYNISKLNYMIDVPMPTNRVGPTISVGCLFKNKKSYFSSTFGFAAHIYTLYANLDFNYYTDFNRNAFYIAPEIGFTTFGFIYIGYSRQISIKNNTDFKLTNQLNIGAFIPLEKTARKYYILGERAKYLDRKRINP